MEMNLILLIFKMQAIASSQTFLPLSKNVNESSTVRKIFF